MISNNLENLINLLSRDLNDVITSFSTSFLLYLKASHDNDEARAYILNSGCKALCSKILEFSNADLKKSKGHIIDILCYSDVRFAFLTALSEFTETDSIWAEKLLQTLLLFRNSSYENFASDWIDPAPYEESANRAMFDNVCVNLLRCEMSAETRKRLLNALQDHIIPHMSNPRLLTDLLTTTVSQGGLVGLLALNGLFTLMHCCGVEYPNFYAKLYTFLVPDVLSSKLRARFFFLLDIFLSSTHLPVYVTASFVKRLARLTLVASLDALTILVPLIVNLLIRHAPALRFLLDGETSVARRRDPFDNGVDDLTQTDAARSSLWELRTLKHHYSPTIVHLVTALERGLPPTETDISELFETTYEELISNEIASSDDVDDKTPISIDLNAESSLLNLTLVTKNLPTFVM